MRCKLLGFIVATALAVFLSGCNQTNNNNNNANMRANAKAPTPKRGIQVATKGTFLRDEWQHVFFTYDGSRKAAGVK